MTCNRSNTGLLIIDVQEKVFAHVERAPEVTEGILKVIKGFQLFDLPIVVTEQYPEGLGTTITPLKCVLDINQAYLRKNSFSALQDESIKSTLLGMPVKTWVIVGIEAHVCVLQTARDLKLSGKDVIVLNDAISSRSLFDFSTSIAEMRDLRVRISSVETVLFELMKTSDDPLFKKFSSLIKD